MSASLRVVTANLATRADPGAFARLMATLDPDVVAVQELSPAQADALTRVLRFGALWPSAGHDGMGIALRRPGAVARLPLPGRGALVAEVGVPGATAGSGPVEVINVHVRAPHLLPPWRTFADRRAQVLALASYLDTRPPRPCALVGDLNSTPGWPLYRRLAARLADAALEAARRDGGRAAATWGPWAGAPRLFRIDHALVSGFAVRASRVVAVAGSDHSAVVVDLALPGGGSDPDA